MANGDIGRVTKVNKDYLSAIYFSSSVLSFPVIPRFKIVQTWTQFVAEFGWGWFKLTTYRKPLGIGHVADDVPCRKW